MKKTKSSKKIVLKITMSMTQRTNATISDELRKRNDTLERLQDCTSRLQKEVKRLRVKAFRAPGQCSFAVEVALAKAANEAKGQSSIWRIKRPDG